MSNTKISKVKVNDHVYDIDLPSDATPSIASLTTSGAVSIGGDLSVAGSADLNNVYTQNIASGKDDEYNLHLSAGDTITFTYSGYTGAQSYIDVPHGKGTSSSHDVLACKSDISALNIIGGTGTGATQQIQDGTSGTFDFTGKNPNATAIDSTLTGNINYGGTGNYATVFGGKAAAIGKRSLAQGTTTVAKGAYSHAEGDNSVALGNDSHAEGYATTASGLQSHSEGFNTVATGTASHSEGKDTKAAGEFSHAEGKGGTANGNYSHIEGVDGKSLTSIPTTGDGSSSDNPGSGSSGSGTSTDTDPHYGETTHVEGESCIAIGYGSHVGGYSSQTNGQYSFAHGDRNFVGGYASAAFGKGNKEIQNSNINYNFTVGQSNTITGSSTISGIIAANNLVAGIDNTLTMGSNGSVENSIVAGESNSLNGLQSSLVVGAGHTSNGIGAAHYSLIAGQNNKLAGYNNIIAGENNTLAAGNTNKSCLVIGQLNSFADANGTNNSALIGYGLRPTPTHSNQLIVGYLNKAYTVNDLPRYFIVGNGKSVGGYSNAFEVLADGRAKVQTAPTEDDDVVRKGDLGTQTTYSYSSGVLTITSK